MFTCIPTVHVNTCTLREKCPYSVFSLSVFSLIWPEYGQEMDQKNSECGHFPRSVRGIFSTLSNVYNAGYMRNS